MSRLPFEIFLALRYLRPKRTFVSAITLVSVAGVMLGVAVMIVVISVMSGFDQQLREKILGFSAHLRVDRPESVLTNYESLLPMVLSCPGVKAVAPTVMGQVLMETQPATGKPKEVAPLLRGVDPQWETNVSTLHSNIIFGSFDVSHHGLLVGVDLAQPLHLHVGDRVAIYSGQKLREMKERQGTKDEVAIAADDFEVRGIFDTGYYEYNAKIIVTSLEDAQEQNRLEGTVHALLVMLHDPFQAANVRRELAKRLSNEACPDCKITLWTEENSGILDALLVEKNVMFYLLFFIMIVAAFGIMNSLITFVVQKTREIGMLKALGATRGQILWLFLSQSLFVGTVGVVTGFGLGMLAVNYRNEFLHLMNRLTGFNLFPPEIYNFTQLPALIVGQDIAIICGSALVICMCAGLIPAWNAARLRPVEALRHE